MEKKDVLIVGGTGYGGAELIKRVLAHPHINLKAITSIDEVGKNIGESLFNFYGRTPLTFEEIPIRKAVEKYKPAAVLLGLPHKVTATIIPEIFDTDVKIVDMSGDYRLNSPQDYKTYYGVDHPDPGNLKNFVYGIPELFRKEIAKAKWVASPGCFATCIILGLAPLAKAGLLNGKIIKTVAATGSSGSGSYPSAGTHHPLRVNNMKIYKVLEHQHLPEIEMALEMLGARDFQLEFVPVSAPLSRGILANTFVDLDEHFSQKDVDHLVHETYEGSSFIKTIQGRKPEIVGIKGTNYCEIGATVSKRLHTKTKQRPLVMTTALDNLVKGGAGQAIQNLNVILGFDERFSLDDFGTWP